MLIGNEKYYIYFYLLSFLLLITLIFVYKNLKIIKKIVISITIIVLCLQLFIIYDTFPLMEHYDTNEQGFLDVKKNITNLLSKVEESNHPDNTNLNNEILRTSILSGKQKNNYYDSSSNSEYNPILTKIVNPAISSRNPKIDYKNIQSLPKDPYYLNTFSQNEIENIITNTIDIYTNTLQNIVKFTNPIV